MKRLTENILRIVLLILLLGTVTVSGFSQSTDSSVECEQAGISVYPDSLWTMLLNFYDHKLIHIADSIQDANKELKCPDLIRIAAHKAYAYEHIFKYEVALEIYHELLNEAEENNFIDEEINIHIGLARVYETLGKRDLCLEHLTELEGIFEEYDNLYEQSHFYVRIASYHRIYDDKQKAREYALLAIEAGEKSGRIGSLAGGYLVLGIVEEDFQKSIEYFEKASSYCYEEGDYVGYLFQELNIARNYRDKGDYNKALSTLNKIEKEIPKFVFNPKNLYQVKAFHAGDKADLYELLGLKDSLVLSLKEAHKYTSLFGEFSNKEEVNRIIFENELAEEKQKIDYQKRVVKFLSLGLFGLAVAILLLTGLYLQNKKKQGLIENQRTTIESQYVELESLYNYQTTLLSEVHHRIKNNLQLIISLLTLQKAKLGGDIGDGVLDMLSYRISSISLIHEQLYNLKEFENVDVGLYVRDLIMNFEGLIHGRNINISYKIDDIQLNIETIIPLGLIWSELISNSVKYNDGLENMTIHFELIQNGESYDMKYYDSGKGYPDGQFKGNSKGMGYTIINSLARQLSAQYNAFNDDGAHFQMTFKQKKISPL